MAQPHNKENPRRDEGPSVWAEAEVAVVKGDACYVSGVSGNVRKMSLVDASSESTARGEILFAAYDMPAGTRGRFVEWLLLRDQDTSSASAQATVYASTSLGGWTASPGSLKRPLGEIVTSDASEGVVLLRSPSPSRSVAKTQILNQTAPSSLPAGAAAALTNENDLLAGSASTTLAAPADGDYVLVVRGYVQTVLA